MLSKNSRLRMSSVDVTHREFTGPRAKLLDVVFTLLPSMDFIGDTKAASKRLNDARTVNGYPKKP
jgi:hypothetical protein